MKIDFDQIRELLAVVSQTDITELTIESGDERVTVKKSEGIPSTTTVAVTPQDISQTPGHTLTAKSEIKETIEEAPAANGLLPITSPMVGTFYRSPSPSAPPFVDVGDLINVGQTICIIEAMKLMNDLPSEIAGKIVKVCVDNGTTVEYGQPLFMVDPRG